LMTGVVMILGFLSIPLLLLREQSIPRPSSIFKQPKSENIR
jgi:putative membrane protein